MKIKYLIAAVLILLIISCKDRMGNFSVNAPEGWVRTDSVSPKGRKMVRMHKVNLDTIPAFVDNISVSVFHYPDVDSYMNSLVAESKKSFSYFEEVDRGSAKVNKYTAKWMQNVIQLKGESYLVDQRVYFIEKRGNVYMITCTSKVKEFNKMKKDIKVLLNSFEILE
jgi:hypothetical protein